VPDHEPESQEEILAASEASLTPGDIPPEDEAFLHPDPETGPPAELLTLTDQELYDLLENTPAYPAQTPTSPPPGHPLGHSAQPPDQPAASTPPSPGNPRPRDGWPLGAGAAGAPAVLGAEGLERGFREGGVLDELPAGITLAGFADDACQRIGDLDDNSLIGVLRAWRRVTSWAQARELAMVAELARRRPADGTPPAAAPGQFPHQISEFAASEAGLALTLTAMAANNEFALAMDLTDRPAIAAALESGQIDLSRARIMISMICPLEPAHADAVEAAVLPQAPGLTTGELRAALQRAILAVDPDAARRRREEAQKDARVEHWADPEGTATLAGRYLPPAEVLAADKRLCAIAEAWKKQGAQGGMDLLRAHVYLALLLGHPITTPPPGLLLPADSPVQAPSSDPSGSPGSPSSPRQWADDSASGSGLSGAPGPSGDPAPQSASIPARGPDPSPGQAADPTTSEPGPAGSTASGPGAAGSTASGPGPAGLMPTGPHQPAVGVPLPPLTGQVNLTIPMVTLLGLADRPGEAAGYGPLHADIARRLADGMATNRTTRWGVIITNQDGQAMGYGSSVRARPLSTGGWKITLTTEPIAPYP
jgi:hypothetical protein